MPFTLWSKNRLLGETDLDYEVVFPKHRSGAFDPTALGEKLMPVITGVGTASRRLCRMVVVRRHGPTGEQLEEELKHTSEQADLSAAEAHFEALELELRGPDGSLIPTDWIDIRDTEEIIAFGEEAEHRRALEELMYPPEKPDLSEEELRALEEDERAMQEEMDAFVAEMEEADASLDANRGWNSRPFPRYQIQVGLVTADDDECLAL